MMRPRPGQTTAAAGLFGTDTRSKTLSQTSGRARAVPPTGCWSTAFASSTPGSGMATASLSGGGGRRSSAEYPRARPWRRPMCSRSSCIHLYASTHTHTHTHNTHTHTHASPYVFEVVLPPGHRDIASNDCLYSCPPLLMAASMRRSSCRRDTQTMMMAAASGCSCPQGHQRSSCRRDTQTMLATTACINARLCSWLPLCIGRLAAGTHRQ